MLSRLRSRLVFNIRRRRGPEGFGESMRRLNRLGRLMSVMQRKSGQAQGDVAEQERQAKIAFCRSCPCLD
jgi:hypothetical protein